MTHKFWAKPRVCVCYALLQKVDLSECRSVHRRQLEDISLQLLRLESCLRAKEKEVEGSIKEKEDVIARQQRIIKRLLKKVIWVMGGIEKIA